MNIVDVPRVIFVVSNRVLQKSTLPSGHVFSLSFFETGFVFEGIFPGLSKSISLLPTRSFNFEALPSNADASSSAGCATCSGSLADEEKRFRVMLESNSAGIADSVSFRHSRLLSTTL